MMENVNFVKCYFIFLVLYTITMYMLLKLFKDRPPPLVARLCLHHKFRLVSDSRFYRNYFESPKGSKMKCVYFVGSVYSMVVLYSLVKVYFLSKPVPRIFDQFLDRLVGEEGRRKVTVDATAAFFGCVLLCCQIWKRLYETTVVSVFSPDSRVNVMQTVLGVAYYVAALTAIIVEAPGFKKPSSTVTHRNSILRVSDLNLRMAVGISLFFWGWYNQYQCAVVLANLRKNEDGSVATHKYRIPVDGLFERLSAPHMFCEILMYGGLQVILWGHTVWPYIFMWVLSDQCQTGLRNHWWYKANFKDYPKERKAVIPFIL